MIIEVLQLGRLAAAVDLCIHDRLAAVERRLTWPSMPTQAAHRSIQYHPFSHGGDARVWLSHSNTGWSACLPLHFLIKCLSYIIAILYHHIYKQGMAQGRQCHMEVMRRLIHKSHVLYCII